MIRNLLVPLDTSYENDDWAEETLLTASKISCESEATIHVLSVIPENLLKGFYPDISTDVVSMKARKKLELMTEKYLPAGIPVECHVEEGGICTEILRMARNLPAHLIVMASHGPMARDYIFGSNAAHVTLHAPCSVFVVRDLQVAT